MDSPITDEAVMEQPVNEAEKLAQQLRNGANWFFWIAGLSLVNSLIVLAGGAWNFVIGLGITQIFDSIGAVAYQELGADGGMAWKGAMIVLVLITTGIFVAFGVLARKMHGWAYVLGMVLYALDGLMFLLAQDWLGAVFHVFALFCLFTGFSASRKLRAMQAPAETVLSAEPITP